MQQLMHYHVATLGSFNLYQQLQTIPKSQASCKVCLTSNDDANDDAKQSQSTAKDFYDQDLDKESRVLCI